MLAESGGAHGASLALTDEEVAANAGFGAAFPADDSAAAAGAGVSGANAAADVQAGADTAGPTEDAAAEAQAQADADAQIEPGRFPRNKRKTQLILYKAACPFRHAALFDNFFSTAASGIIDLDSRLCGRACFMHRRSAAHERENLKAYKILAAKVLLKPPAAASWYAMSGPRVRYHV